MGPNRSAPRFRAWCIAYAVAVAIVSLGAGHAVRAADAAAPGVANAPAAVTTPPARPVDQNLLPLSPDQVLTHARQTVDWYHYLQSLQELQAGSEDVIARDRIRQQSITAVALAFDFGQASAKLLRQQAQAAGPAPGATGSKPTGASSGAQPAGASPGAQPAANPRDDNDASDSSPGFAGQLDQASDSLAQRVADLQNQLGKLDDQLVRARGPVRATLAAQRGETESALNLTKAIQTTVQDMQRFQQSAIFGESKGQGELAAQLADLRRTVPEVAAVQKSQSSTGSGATQATATQSAAGSQTPPGAAKPSGATSPASAPTSPATTPAFQPESAGVIALATEWFSSHNSRRQIDDSIKRTNALRAKTEELRTSVSNAVRDLVRGSLAASDATDVAQLASRKAALDAGATRFKQLSTVLLPIGEQGLILESVQDLLLEWRDSLGARNALFARYLALRLGFLVASIVVVLAVSEIWRRATFRYLHDTRRRRQFLVLRRVVVTLALIIVIVFGLVSEMGSIATYIGFVTAGIAVALQNVILAVVAYFFLIGRYGVRVGDRITLAGVTGRVVDIGMVRIYLMELAGPELHSTGRIVVLSNAVLFQPTAMFKQIPGADYAWHSATLTIEATADIEQAHRRLKAAADAVYAKYRKAIDLQHEAVQRFIDFDTSAPQPEVRVRWAQAGLECAVRYPVEPENSAAVDQQMLHALRAALEKDPALTLVPGSAVAIKSSD